MRIDSSFVLCVGLGLLLAREAIADAQYLAKTFSHAGPAAPSFRGEGPTGSHPLYTGYQLDIGNVYYESAPGVVIAGKDLAGGHAIADRGFLSVYSTAGQQEQGGCFAYYGTSIDTTSEAMMSFDDVVLQPISPGAPGFTNVIFWAPLQCRLADPYAGGRVYDTVLVNGFPTQTFATIKPEIRLSAELNTADLSYDGLTGGNASIIAQGTNAAGTTYFGPIADSVLGTHLPEFDTGTNFFVGLPFLGVPVGVPLQLTIDLQTRISGGYGFPAQGGEWQSLTSVYCTMNFASAAIAQLPASLTLNSNEAGIQNNVYDPVPEPDVVAQLACGSFVLSALRGRRSRRAGQSPGTGQLT
jgi:hypothetical protein